MPNGFSNSSLRVTDEWNADERGCATQRGARHVEDAGVAARVTVERERATGSALLLPEVVLVFATERRMFDDEDRRDMICGGRVGDVAEDTRSRVRPSGLIKMIPRASMVHTTAHTQHSRRMPHLPLAITYIQPEVGSVHRRSRRTHSRASGLTRGTQAVSNKSVQARKQCLVGPAQPALARAPPPARATVKAGRSAGRDVSGKGNASRLPQQSERLTLSSTLDIEMTIVTTCEVFEKTQKACRANPD